MINLLYLISHWLW